MNAVHAYMVGVGMNRMERQIRKSDLDPAERWKE